MFTNARRQTYSAIANRAAGIFYYGSVGNTSEYWDRAFDLIKEINLFQYILCQRDNYDWNAAYDIKWRTIQIDDRFFMFAINDTDIVRTVNVSQFGSLTLNGHECGVWTANDSAVRKLSSPLNLSFERNLSSTSADSNWLYSGQAQLSASWHKMEAKALQLKDTSNNSRTWVEQFFNCVPGYTYEVKVWYMTDDEVLGQTGNQRLILQYYNGGTWLSESSAVETATNMEWTQLSVSMEAPVNATKAKIHIDSGSQVSYTNSVYWDDMVVEMSLASSSPKILVQRMHPASPKIAVENNHPNPFNSATTINFEISSQELVIIKIYNSLGKLINILANGNMLPGKHTVKWDGRDENGIAVSSGIYFYKLSLGNVSKTFKMTLLQ